MTKTIFLALICALSTTSCRPPASSPFVAAFNPLVTLNKIGVAAGISYANGLHGESFGGDVLRGVQAQKDWFFSFAGSHAELAGQLDALRAEVERQLLSSGAKISGRGTWSGDEFSGFSFEYSSGKKYGFVRVTGISLESGKKGLEVLVYEY